MVKPNEVEAYPVITNFLFGVIEYPLLENFIGLA
jgi:hypothetical protein